MKRYLVTGLLVLIPLFVTAWVLKTLVHLMDQTLQLIPPRYQPEALLGFNIPGLGVVLTVLLILVTGAIAANFFGRQMINVAEAFLERIPIVRGIYSGTKQITETLFSNTGQSFRKVLLIQYPREGLWTIAFQTSTTQGEAQTKTGREVVNVYVPTTPNPTSGFFIMVPREDTIELNISVDSGLKMLLSMGVVVPPWPPAKLPPPVAAPDSTP